MSKSRGNCLSPHRPPPGVRPAAPAQNPRPPRLAKILATAPVSRFPHRSVATRTYRGSEARGAEQPFGSGPSSCSAPLRFLPLFRCLITPLGARVWPCLAPNADCGRDVARRRGAERCHRRPWPQKRQSGASPSVRNRSARGSGYPANRGSNPVSRGWPPNACGKLTARQPRERGVPRLK